jgi:hypothetical protein
MDMVKELKDKAPPVRTHEHVSHAAVAANGVLASRTPSAHGVKAVSLQAQREVIVSIRNPLTISKLRAVNPCNLKSHMERALEQSQNEHIAHVKNMSSNQLESGDLSLRTATTSDTGSDSFQTTGSAESVTERTSATRRMASLHTASAPAPWKWTILKRSGRTSCKTIDHSYHKRRSSQSGSSRVIFSVHAQCFKETMQFRDDAWALTHGLVS